jgi:serine/threonine protein phosphatase PrpC
MINAMYRGRGTTLEMRGSDTAPTLRRHTGIKIVALIAIMAAAIGLVKLAGGFPPLSWVLLARVLPHMALMWQAKGVSMMPAFLSLVVICLSLLVAWLLLLYFFISIVRSLFSPTPRRNEGGGGGGGGGAAYSARDWQVEDHDEKTHPIVGLRPLHIDEQAFEKEYWKRTGEKPPEVPEYAGASVSTRNRRTEDLEDGRPILGARERHYARIEEPDTQPLGTLGANQVESAGTQPWGQQSWWQQDQQVSMKDTGRDWVYQQEMETKSHGMASAVAEQDEEADVPFITEPVEDEVMPGHLARFFLEQEGPNGMEERKRGPEGTEGGERLTFAFGIGLDVGIMHRGSPNEDSVFATTGVRVSSSEPRPAGLFIVADGLGGHTQGREASHMAVSEASDAILPVLFHETPGDGKGEEDLLRELIQEGVHRANFALYQRNSEEAISMGTTFTGALMVDRKAYVANVGDSRTYFYRPGDGLRQVTRDHSLVMRMVEVGALAREDIYVHPLRNQVYRSLGNAADVEVEVKVVDIRVGDFLLLCSDGLWEMVRDNEIESIMKRHSSPSQLSAELVQAALRHGGVDNIGVVVVKAIREDG